ncbi:MAG: LuxR C-terminal-related transcriptional regulator [Bacteroidaceae bacterium]|nr:LuxR C-terminal-related transcriptional regulator [Bacteroidaceae bacterium]
MTGRYHETDPMSDVISDDYRMLQMISRFGITLGFGDQTVAETCTKAGVNTATFLTVVNFLTDTNHAHINEMVERIDLPTLLRYLENSHTYFIEYRLPAIRRRLIQAIDMRSQIAMLIIKFYDEYVAEVTRHMQFENAHVHPYVSALLQGHMGQQRISEITGQHEGSHTSIDRSLTELKNIIIKYYPSDQNAALLSDVLMDIYMMEEDFLNHCHMEDTLFTQCVRLLEEEVATSARSPEEEMPLEEESNAGASKKEQEETLSEREREVIRLVAMGLSNKEIADRMFIAVNTVMTHRRNISRKLDIHAAAGLTIYAIVNGIINVEDVKL